MPFEHLVSMIDGAVATLTINRPKVLNALDAATLGELGEAMRALQADASVRVVILTGSGERAFVAGADINELATLAPDAAKAHAELGQRVFERVERLGKPVIAAVNGYALGGGCELALACHIRIASDRAKFGQPEVNLGVIPGYGGTQRLARLVGTGLAAEMILSGVQVDAAEALRIGLVNRVVPHAELMDRAKHIARTISSMGQVAVRLALESILAASSTTLAQGLALEAKLFGESCASEDFKEGTTAFLEKRKPAFKNR